VTTAFVCAACALVAAGSADGFDGAKWNISTGNLSVQFIQGSPVGAHPREGYNMEPPPSHETLVEMKRQGLVCYEDYVAWGAIEREPGKWDWRQHDAVCDAVKKAGLHYVVYNWTHFPPVWLRDPSTSSGPTGSGRTDRTLMRCVEHGKDTNYLSIYDPKTVGHYDHFYKALSEHFGDRIDGVYACILGPYGEGNYPLYVPDWVNIGHCHEGYWCADPYALAAFRDAMRAKYQDIASLNKAWGTSCGSFSDVRPPKEIADGSRYTPEAFPTGQDRRRWLDFITWYHQAIIDFAEDSVKVTLKYFPKHKVRTKPGGNAGGVNPIAWGTYCPGYAKMAGKYGIVLQPADCRGAVFGDKWVGTSYRFYEVPLSTEPAGGLDRNTFVRRMFSDASCGASQLFTYEFSAHVPEIQAYVHLLTGEMGETEIAVFCPTTLYRLGGDLGPTIRVAEHLRDLAEFDVLDELLITDGALSGRYKALVILQGDFVDKPILEAIEKWVRAGGHLILSVPKPVCDVEGQRWTAGDLGKGKVSLVGYDKDEKKWMEALAPVIRPHAKYDGVMDGVRTTRRGRETLLYNGTDDAIISKAGSREVEVAPHSIVSVR